MRRKEKTHAKETGYPRIKEPDEELVKQSSPRQGLLDTRTPTLGSEAEPGAVIDMDALDGLEQDKVVPHPRPYHLPKDCFVSSLRCDVQEKESENEEGADT